MDVYYAGESCHRILPDGDLPFGSEDGYTVYHAGVLKQLITMPEIRNQTGCGYLALVNGKKLDIYCPGPEFKPSELGFKNVACVTRGHKVASYNFNHNDLPLRGLECRILVDIRSYWLEVLNSAEQQLRHLDCFSSEFFNCN